MITPLVTLSQVLEAPGGRALLERHLPAELTTRVATDLRDFLVGSVLQVTPGSPFAAAGVRAGDVLRALGGHEAGGVHASVMLPAAAGEALFASPEGTEKRVPLPPTP